MNFRWITLIIGTIAMSLQLACQPSGSAGGAKVTGPKSTKSKGKSERDLKLEAMAKAEKMTPQEAQELKAVADEVQTLLILMKDGHALIALTETAIVAEYPAAGVSEVPHKGNRQSIFKRIANTLSLEFRQDGIPLQKGFVCDDQQKISRASFKRDKGAIVSGAIYEYDCNKKNKEQRVFAWKWTTINALTIQFELGNTLPAIQGKDYYSESLGLRQALLRKNVLCQVTFEKRKVLQTLVCNLEQGRIGQSINEKYHYELKKFDFDRNAKKINDILFFVSGDIYTDDHVHPLKPWNTRVPVKGDILYQEVQPKTETTTTTTTTTKPEDEYPGPNETMIRDQERVPQEGAVPTVGNIQTEPAPPGIAPTGKKGAVPVPSPVPKELERQFDEAGNPVPEASEVLHEEKAASDESPNQRQFHGGTIDQPGHEMRQVPASEN